MTGHGNTLYLIDADCSRPSGDRVERHPRRDNRCSDQRGPSASRTTRDRLDSVGWAATVFVRWLAEHEPESVARARYGSGRKDWIVCCLTGVVSADYSDASANGLLNLAARRYEDAAFAAVGLPATLRSLLPPLSRSNDVVGVVSAPGVIATSIPQGHSGGGWLHGLCGEPNRRWIDCT